MTTHPTLTPQQRRKLLVLTCAKAAKAQPERRDEYTTQARAYLAMSDYELFALWQMMEANGQIDWELVAYL